MVVCYQRSYNTDFGDPPTSNLAVASALIQPFDSRVLGLQIVAYVRVMDPTWLTADAAG